ncbi:hypothetical protein F66182_5910 [Fusarium sp. NRRL 66182]|nr:hypothetical protein F66182_5910 [Fusarium sp. NRRL 66182]
MSFSGPLRAYQPFNSQDSASVPSSTEPLPPSDDYRPRSYVAYSSSGSGIPASNAQDGYKNVAAFEHATSNISENRIPRPASDRRKTNRIDAKSEASLTAKSAPVLAPRATNPGSNHEAFLKSFEFLWIADYTEELKSLHFIPSRWFTEDEVFSRWKRLLWLRGLEGSGKSTLMRQAVHTCTQNEPDSVHLTYPFNPSGHELPRTRLGLVKALLYQLVPPFPSAFSEMEARFDKIQASSPASQQVAWGAQDLYDDLVKALPKILKTHPLYIYVDGINHAGDENAKRLVQDLSRMVEKSRPSAKQPGIAHGLKILFSTTQYPPKDSFPQSCIDIDGKNGPSLRHHVQDQLSRTPTQQVQFRPWQPPRGSSRTGQSSPGNPQAQGIESPQLHTGTNIPPQGRPTKPFAPSGPPEALAPWQRKPVAPRPTSVPGITPTPASVGTQDKINQRPPISVGKKPAPSSGHHPAPQTRANPAVGQSPITAANSSQKLSHNQSTKSQKTSALSGAKTVAAGGAGIIAGGLGGYLLSSHFQEHHTSSSRTTNHHTHTDLYHFNQSAGSSPSLEPLEPMSEPELSDLELPQEPSEQSDTSSGSEDADDDQVRDDASDTRSVTHESDAQSDTGHSYAEQSDSSESNYRHEPTGRINTCASEDEELESLHSEQESNSDSEVDTEEEQMSTDQEEGEEKDADSDNEYLSNNGIDEDGSESNSDQGDAYESAQWDDTDYEDEESSDGSDEDGDGEEGGEEASGEYHQGEYYQEGGYEGGYGGEGYDVEDDYGGDYQDGGYEEYDDGQYGHQYY